MSDYPATLAALTARSQKSLIEFLEVDLDLAFTFLQTAVIEAGSDEEHCRSAFKKAQLALDSILRFQERIEDASQSKKIQGRTNELKLAIDAFQKSI
jgi:hypothetical protein